jgi:DNA helicase-2/ATP-dependent DNA helicase PcrA
MTRAKNELHLVHPLRMFIRQQARFGDAHVFTPRTRFIPDEVLPCFERATAARPEAAAALSAGPAALEKIRHFWD